jgi:SAM-dependent methyltransferase
MRKFAEEYRGREHEMVVDMRAQASDVRSRIDGIRSIRPSDHVLEVGSGGCGLIFNFGGDHAVGVDPLADHLRQIFPWQGSSEVPTIQAEGEDLPFDTGAFDIVLSDNVVDHARDPRRILEEIARVLKPGGLFYFTVHVHHPIYRLSSDLYGAWHALRLPGEVTPFADHTVHLTPRAARQLFRDLPLQIVQQGTDRARVREEASKIPPRHWGDRLKRLFFKNVTWEVFAIRS